MFGKNNNNIIILKSYGRGNETFFLRSLSVCQLISSCISPSPKLLFSKLKKKKKVKVQTAHHTFTSKV